MKRHPLNWLKRCALGLVTTACLGTSHANSGPELLFSGFATLGYSRIADNDTARFTVGLGTGGTDSDGSFLLDSRAALQTDVIFNDKLSATVQGLLREDQDAEFRPHLEWAFGKYQLNETFSARVGRIALPVYAISDYREVGYATDFVRPPSDMYAQVPLRNMDGADVLADLSFGDVYVNAQFFGGVAKARLGRVLNSTITGYGMNLSAEYGIGRVRLSHINSEMEVSSPELSMLRAGLSQAAAAVPTLQTIAQLASRGTKQTPANVSWSALGLALNFSRLYIDAEYALRNDDSIFPSSKTFYVGAGIRLGSVTPYMFVSDSQEFDRAEAVAFPPTTDFDTLAQAVTSVTADTSQSSTGIGFRWDFKPKFAFKTQVEFIERKEIGISFTDMGGRTQLDDGKDVTVVSAVIDIIF